MHKNFKIIYMGTPAFAVEPLKKILDAGYPVAAVITSPDKPAGRGRNTQPSEVKLFADSMGMETLQPANLKDPSFLNQLQAYHADLFVVVAFRMLPEQVWSMPPKGTINLHASLLPQYRGAAPINHAIMNGEKVTGVTTFFINREIDTGQILLQREVGIPETFIAGELHDLLMMEGSQLLVETIEMIEQGTLHPVPQSSLVKKNEILKPAPKILKENCRIDWNMDILRIYNFIRGLSPRPSAFSFLKGSSENLMIRFFRAGYEYKEHQFSPGKIIITGKKKFMIAVPGGFIVPEQIQQAGKNRIDARSFINGIRDLESRYFV